jgi:hypothetical protein
MHDMNVRAYNMGEPKDARERREVTHDPRKLVFSHYIAPFCVEKLTPPGRRGDRYVTSQAKDVFAEANFDMHIPGRYGWRLRR